MIVCVCIYIDVYITSPHIDGRFFTHICVCVYVSVGVCEYIYGRVCARMYVRMWGGERDKKR